MDRVLVSHCWVKKTKMPWVKTSIAFGAQLICRYEKQRPAVNAMVDGSRWSSNLLEFWTHSIMNIRCIFNFIFLGMKHHAWLAIWLDTKVSLFSSQMVMVYKLWRIVQLVSCCFQLKSNNPCCPTFRKFFFFKSSSWWPKLPIFTLTTHQCILSKSNNSFM